MPQSALRLIKRCAVYIPNNEILHVSKNVRGIYVLYKEVTETKPAKYNVVYVGMAAAGRMSGIRGRLMAHKKHKSDLWTHFSIFEVWDNIRDDEIVELEGLFRFIYKKDSNANQLNRQKGFRKLGGLKRRLANWDKD